MKPGFRYGLLFLAFLLCSLFPFSTLNAQDNPDSEVEEFKILLNVQDVAYYETDALYFNDHLYISVYSLFQQLKIFTKVKNEFSLIDGYIANPIDTFSINFALMKIRYKDVTDTLSAAKIMKNDYGLFLRVDELEKIFKLKISFNFRTLSAYLSCKTDLPLIKQLKREKIRKNLQNIKGEIKVDTTFKRKYHWAKGGVFDWKINMAQVIGRSASFQGQAAVGMELLGGELLAHINQPSNGPFNMYSQTMTWRMVNNNSKILRQIQLGNIPAAGVSTISSSIIGGGISNVPTTFQKQYGTYHLFNKTQPNWEVELYVNDLLVDFKTADANGNFQFDVPLLYGNTKITLKYYGPWGEERSEEREILVPSNFIPKKQLQYQAYSGYTFDAEHDLYSSFKLVYGVNRSICIGTGFEYFQKTLKDKSVPYLTVSARLFGSAMLNYMYCYNVKNSLNFTLPFLKKLYLETNFSQFTKNQDAIITSDKYDLSSGLSVPMTTHYFSGYNKILYRYNRTPNFGFHYIDYYLSFAFRKFSIVFANSAGILSQTYTVNSSVSLNYVTSDQYIFNAQVMANLKTIQMNSVRIDAQKKFFKKIITDINYTYAPVTNSFFLNFSMRFDLNFAQTSLASFVSKNSVTTEQDIYGSLLFSPKRPNITPSSRSLISSCGIDVIVFLDINHNGIKDPGEPFIKDVNVNISQGSKANHGDSVYRFIALKPNTQYLLTIDNSSLQNISWLAKFSTIAVYSDPDQVKTIFVPVEPMAEVSGTVYFKSDDAIRTAKNITVNIYKKDGKLFTSATSDEDGYFNYMGLPPGIYSVNIDTLTAKNMNGEILQDNIPFTVHINRNGDLIEHLDLYLRKTGKNGH